MYETLQIKHLEKPGVLNARVNDAIIHVWLFCKDNHAGLFPFVSIKSISDPILWLASHTSTISTAPLRLRRPACGFDKLFITVLIHMLIASVLYIKTQAHKKMIALTTEHFNTEPGGHK